MFVRHPCCRVLVVSNVNADGHDETGLSNGRAKSLLSSKPATVRSTNARQGSVSYGLIRKAEWVSAPMGQTPGQLLPPALGFCINPKHAWIAFSIEEAQERAELILCAWGYHTEIKAITLQTKITSTKNNARST
jgi:hypothetical protein